MSDPVSTQAMPRTVARFADGLLGSDLPSLPDDRRRAAVEFIGRRVRVLPSITRFGVLVIAGFVHAVGMIFGHDRVRRIVLRLPLPLLAEYPRLIRSLGYAYIWETWPDTDVDGGRSDRSRVA
jgi:hypothetical protein